jgi:hypothetical protein
MSALARTKSTSRDGSWIAELASDLRIEEQELEAWLGWELCGVRLPEHGDRRDERLAIRSGSRLLANVEQPQAVHLEHVVHPWRDVFHAVQVDAGWQIAADRTSAEDVRADLVDLPDLFHGAHVSTASREELSPSAWEHVFVTAQPPLSSAFAERSSVEHWDGRGRRSRANEPSLEDTLQLVHLYFERGSPTALPAALRCSCATSPRPRRA